MLTERERHEYLDCLAEGLSPDACNFHELREIALLLYTDLRTRHGESCEADSANARIDALLWNNTMLTKNLQAAELAIERSHENAPAQEQEWGLAEVEELIDQVALLKDQVATRDALAATDKETIKLLEGLSQRYQAQLAACDVTLLRFMRRAHYVDE